MEGDHRRKEREEINQNEIHIVRSGHEQPQRSLSFSVRRSEEGGDLERERRRKERRGGKEEQKGSRYT
jgi:hypothetical protein